MSKWRIMIVDDEPDIVDIICQVLKQKYEVIEANNGLDALEKLERSEPDLIILDVMMPLMNGFDTCAAIRKNPLYRETPIYFLTSLHSEEDVKRAYSLGCTLYLQKPLEPLRLLKNIDFYYKENPVQPRKKRYTIQELEIMEKGPAPEAEPHPGAPPDVHPVAQPAQAPKFRPGAKPPVRVLVVDDNKEALDFVHAALTLKSGGDWVFEVIPTTNPVDALSRIVYYQPDIVILDIRMPKLDGFQLCKILRLNQNLKDTEIQFISAVAEPNEAVIAHKLSGNKLIREPIDMNALRETVIKVCQKPTFNVKPKKVSYKEIEKEIQRQEQQNQEVIRREQEKQFIEKKMHPLSNSYKELEREMKLFEPGKKVKPKEEDK
jgi:CheY-like chemotaxis protein